MFPRDILQEMFGVEYFIQVLPERELRASLLDRSTGRMWIEARRPELYGPLTVPTGRERSARELKFEE